jgi:hypothetical protein
MAFVLRQPNAPWRRTSVQVIEYKVKENQTTPSHEMASILQKRNENEKDGSLFLHPVKRNRWSTHEHERNGSGHRCQIPDY